MTQPNPMFQKKFEAGFEPSVTKDQKEHIESAKQKLGAAAAQVQGAADDARSALDQQQLHGGIGQQYTATTATTIHPTAQIDTEQHKGLLESAKETFGGAMQAMKDKLSGGVEVTREKLGDAMDVTKQKAGDAVDATKQAAHNVYDAAGSAVDRTKEAAGSAMEKTKEVAGSAVDKTKEVAGSAVDKTKELAGSAAEKTKGAAQSAYGSAAHAVDVTKQKAQDMYHEQPETNIPNYPETYAGQRVQYITPEEAERLGFTANYPALLQGYEQNAAYGSTGVYRGANEPAPDYLKESSNIGQGISSAVGSAGVQMREAAGSAAESGKNVLGAMGERLSGAVHAIVGEAPPNRELEQQGQTLIQQHREQQQRAADMARLEQGQGNLSRRQQAADIMFDDRQRALNQQGKRFNEGANVISDFKQNAGQAMHDLGDKFKQP